MLTVDELKVLLSCNPETGELFWKERPPHLFKTDQAARDWNSKYIGARAAILYLPYPRILSYD